MLALESDGPDETLYVGTEDSEDMVFDVVRELPVAVLNDGYEEVE